MRSMSEHKPIKRDPAIVTLSREHHSGLQLVWKVRYGITNKIHPKRICSYVLFFIKKELEPHFRDEERYLFPLLKVDDPLRVRAESEHGVIRNLAEAIRQSHSNQALCEQFAKLLELHIRFEERELFNYIQNTIPNDLLAEIGFKLTVNSRVADHKWTDHFWVKDNH